MFACNLGSRLAECLGIKESIEGGTRFTGRASGRGHEVKDGENHDHTSGTRSPDPAFDLGGNALFGRCHFAWCKLGHRSRATAGEVKRDASEYIQ